MTMIELERHTMPDLPMSRCVSLSSNDAFLFHELDEPAQMGALKGREGDFVVYNQTKNRTFILDAEDFELQFIIVQ